MMIMSCWAAFSNKVAGLGLTCTQHQNVTRLSHKPPRVLILCGVDANCPLGLSSVSSGKPLFTICSQEINSRLITSTQPPPSAL